MKPVTKAYWRTSKKRVDKKISESIRLKRKESLYYLPEQTSNGREVEIMMTANGGWHRLRTTLPALKRNTVYTLRGMETVQT